MKTLTTILATVATVFALALTGFAGADSLTYVNAARADHGLAAVQHSGSLAAYADQHVKAMAEAGEIYHSGLEVGAAEIVGRGASAKSIHDAFMASPAHRSALLGDFSHAGAASVESSTGVLYVAIVFDGTATPATTTTTTTTTTTLPTPQDDPAPSRASAPGRTTTTVSPPICPTLIAICLE